MIIKGNIFTINIIVDVVYTIYCCAVCCFFLVVCFVVYFFNYIPVKINNNNNIFIIIYIYIYTLYTTILYNAACLLVIVAFCVCAVLKSNFHPMHKPREPSQHFNWAGKFVLLH